jgi:hypothetical protein
MLLTTKVTTAALAIEVSLARTSPKPKKRKKRRSSLGTLPERRLSKIAHVS